MLPPQESLATSLLARLDAGIVQQMSPPPGAEEVPWEEGLGRVGLGAPDVPAAVRALQARGIVFVDHGAVQPSDKGALTQFYLGGVTFELVVSHL